MNNNRKKKTQTQTPGEERLKSFLDMIAPSVIQFYTDHYICGNTFRSVLLVILNIKLFLLLITKLSPRQLH